MSSRKASAIASSFQVKALRLNETRRRIEGSYAAGKLRLADVESTYAGLFLQLVVSYETAVEDFVLGLLVRPGGVTSGRADVRGRIKVRSYAHALQIASGPGGRYASWIGKTDLLAVSALLLTDALPFANSALDWNFVEQSRVIRNAIAHPSEHALATFRKRVVQQRPLPHRETLVPGYLRGRASAGGQTRWELLAAGLGLFVMTTIN